MFSFRKIINTLVLISYVKMTIISSFAMDSAYFGLNDKIRIEINKSTAGGELESMSFRVYTKDGSLSTKPDYKLVQQDSINFLEARFSDNVTPFPGQQNKVIHWQVAGLGTIVIDPYGEITFQNITNTQNTIKIVTPGIILFQACALANVSLKAQGAAITDGSQIGHLKAKLAKLGTLMLVGNTEQSLGHLDLISGHLHNFTQLSILANSRWNLHGNAAVNYGSINITAPANLIIDNALFFLNLNRITGNRLVVLNRNTAITEEDVALQMALMTNITTLLPPVISRGLIPGLTASVLDYLIPVIGQSLNLGTIDVANLSSNRGKFKNAEIGTITIHDGSQSKIGNLKNEGLFKTLASSGSVPLTLQRFSNEGTLDYASRIIIGRSKSGYASRLVARTSEPLQFLTPTILRGTVAQVMPMTLHGAVINHALFEVLPDLLASAFGLKVHGSFDNHATMNMAHDLALDGSGVFTNHAELKTNRFKASSSIKVANRDLISATDVQSDAAQFDNAGGRVVASHDVQITSDKLTNSKGQIFAGGKVAIKAKNLDNTDGQIDGVGGTDVTLTGTDFTGSGGRIGTVGETNLTFAQDTTVEDIGTVAGDKTRLQQDKTGRTVTINKGVVAGKTIAHVLLSNITANVDFATPLLYISSPNWKLSNQAQAARTMVSVLPTYDYQLINAYRTKGTLELWQNGIHSLADIEQHWENLYGDKTKDKPAATHTVSILANVQADQGFKFYLPQATLHVNDNVAGDITELLCPDSQLHMRVAKFDLERGCVAALSADSWAAHGHHIGRLVEDPTRRVFASFFDLNASHLCDQHIKDVTLTFDGNTYSGIYDGYHLLTLPFFVQNSSQFIVRNGSSLRGHIVQRAFYQAAQTTLDTDQLSTFIGSTSHFDKTLHLKGCGNIVSSLPIGVVNFTYNGSEQRAYEFRVGVTDYFRAGVMQSDNLLEFLALANDTHVNQIIGEIRKPCHEHHSPLKSIVVDMSSDQGKTYDQARDFNNLIKAFSWYRVRYIGPGRTSNSYYFLKVGNLRNVLHRAIQFYDVTQGLNGGTHLHVPHSSSVDGGMTLVDTNTRIEGIVQTSRALFAVAQGSHFVLGTNNPYYIDPAKPVRNLVDGKFHSFNLHITPGLQEILAQVNAPQFLFAMRTRFWHDDAASQEFYAPIINDVVVHHPRDGFRKIQGRAVFSLSPELLLERVRTEVQTVLLRGYVDDNTPIDFAYLQQLHRNAAEYLRECKLDAPSVSRALVSGHANSIPDVTKPMLLYTSMMNDQGVEELSPRLIIPPAMIDEMRKAKGGYVRTNVLAILDNTVTHEEALHLYRDQPKLVADLKQYGDQHPEEVAQWDARAKRAKELKDDPQATLKLTKEFGSTTLLGTFKVGQMGINTSTPLFIRADIEAQDAFLKSLHDIWIQSEKGRVQTSFTDFYERITTQARIHVAGLLKIITAENLTLESVKTHSGLGTEMKALGSILDIPIELISHTVTYEHGRKRTTRTETTRTTNVGSDHSSDKSIIQEAGVDVDQQAVHMKAKEKINIKAQRDIHVRDVQNTEQIQKQTTRNGTFRTRSTNECSGNSRSDGATYEASEAIFTAETGNATFTNTTFDCLTTDIYTLQGLTSFLLGVNDAYYSCIKSSQGAAWSRTSIINEQHRTYSQAKILGEMHVHSKETLVQLVEGQSQEILDLIEVDGGPVVKQFLKEMHKCDRKVIQGPGQALMALIAIALTIITQGAGAALATQIGLAGNAVAETVLGALVTSVGSQFTAGMLQNGGNFGKAAKTLTDKDFLKGLATQLAVAGLSAGIMAHFDIKVPSGADASKMSFTDLAAQHAKVQAVQQGVSGTARVIRGEKLGTVLKDVGIQVAASSVAAAAANKTGALKSDGKIDSAGHKILHAGIGAGLGAATSKDRAAGAAAGAAGAFVGESVAEMMGDDAATTRAKATEDVRKSGKPMTDENIGKAYRARVETAMNWGKLAAGFVAFAAGMDVTTALFTAANALHNNYATTAEREGSRGEQASSSHDDGYDTDEEADQQAYGKARKKAIDAITPELAKKYGAKIADYAENVIFGPDGYADEMIKVIKETTGLNDVSPEIRQMLKETATTALKGVGVALDAPGEGTEYILLKAGVDRATARNVHRAINDVMMVAGVAGLAKSAAQFGARGASSSSKAATRTNLDMPTSQKKPDNFSAKNANSSASMGKKLSALQNAQTKAVKVVTLSDGRVRYYRAERASTTPGATRGASLVTEHNPKTGQVRQWNECYDHNGKVNRVHPKSLDGHDLKGQHYPPTQSELNSFSKTKGSKK